MTVTILEKGYFQEKFQYLVCKSMLLLKQNILLIFLKPTLGKSFLKSL